jgi:hypothetical protein
VPGRPEAHPSFFWLIYFQHICLSQFKEWWKDGKYIKITISFYDRREFKYIINCKFFIGCIFKLLNEKISPKIKFGWNGI